MIMCRRIDNFRKTYILNGAIYISSIQHFMSITDSDPFTCANPYLYLMDKVSSIDIDEYSDFLIAEFLLKNKETIL